MTAGRDTQAQGAGSYVSVNGLDMYYEIHGAGQPLVLLHDAFSAIGASFENVLPELAEIRRVIAFEMQAHRHTADIDRPLSMEQMADDTVSALEQLGIENAGFFGFSMGADIALQAAIRRPQVVRKFVLASVTYN
jgi:pimeloyl-ACP methyl ester carboxylesterase